MVKWLVEEFKNKENVFFWGGGVVLGFYFFFLLCFTFLLLPIFFPEWPLFVCLFVCFQNNLLICLHQCCILAHYCSKNLISFPLWNFLVTACCLRPFILSLFFCEITLIIQFVLAVSAMSPSSFCNLPET